MMGLLPCCARSRAACSLREALAQSHPLPSPLTLLMSASMFITGVGAKVTSAWAFWTFTVACAEQGKNN